MWMCKKCDVILNPETINHTNLSKTVKHNLLPIDYILLRTDISERCCVRKAGLPVTLFSFAKPMELNWNQVGNVLFELNTFPSFYLSSVVVNG